MKKLGLILAVSLAAVLAIAQSAFAAGGWTTVSVPSTGNNVSLLGASARTNADAWAVGQQFVGGGTAAGARRSHITGTERRGP